MTEALLRTFVQERLSPNAVFDTPVVGSGIKHRPDIYIREFNLVIEFDGWRHYQQSKLILADRFKDLTYKNMGLSVKRLPYFVQLDTKIVAYLFGKWATDTSAFNSYPHGFIDPSALLPADFSELGVSKFRQDLITFDCISPAILSSLGERAKTQNYKSVFPLSFKRKD